MANMIIKPSSGNSLVFQDEGGDAALTVGTTGNTTLAGTANNLGTVASGDLSNSAIVYPAGHVKKITAYQPTVSTAALRPANGNTTLFSFDFTPLSSTNHLLVRIGYGYQFYGDSVNDNANANFYHKHNGVVMHDSSNGYIGHHANNIGGSDTYHISFTNFSQYYITIFSLC